MITLRATDGVQSYVWHVISSRVAFALLASLDIATRIHSVKQRSAQLVYLWISAHVRGPVPVGGAVRSAVLHHEHLVSHAAQYGS